MSASKVGAILKCKFEAKHIDAALEHYVAVTEKFISEDWDGVALKAGKFVEAITKALVLHCGKSLPINMRNFKAGNELDALKQTDKSIYADAVRIVVPKACLFVYEVVNNRGGRHDAGEIDANSFDATVIVPIVQWILAELVRFSTVGGDIVTAGKLIEGITQKIYPYFEKIDGRTYVSAKALGAPAIAVLLAYEAYPSHLGRKELEASIMRHGVSKSAAAMALNRNKTLFDEQSGNLTLRAIGRQKAEDILRSLRAQ